MVENKEVKIAIIVGIIMVTICLLAFIFAKSEKKVEYLDLQVYKLYEIDASKDEYEYRPCSIKTDDIQEINPSFQKILQIKSEDKLTGKQIKGNYQVRSGDTFIAFDADNDYVYRSDTAMLYSYKTSMYEYVKKICG